MRILVASHTYIVDLNCEKFRALSTLQPDLHVTVVVPKRWRPGGVQNKTIETQAWQDGSFRVIPVSNFHQNHQGLLCFGFGIIPILKDFKPDIIQVEQGSRSLAYAELITLNHLLNLKAKCTFFTWWNLPYQLKFPISTLEDYNLRFTDGLVAGNQDAVDILRSRGYQGATHIAPQLGVDEHRFQPTPQPSLANSLGITADEFIVGFVGRFVPEKGLQTLANALAQLSDYPWKWLLLGRGPLKEELQQWALEANLSDRLIWVESVPHDQVPDYINLMSTLVLPSETAHNFQTMTATGWKEQFGHVLIEAMACRVPVIGSDSGEIPNVIRDAGLIFPEGNVDRLATSLRQLMVNAEQADQIANAGFNRVQQKYTNEALAKDLFGFYKEILDC